VTFTSPFSIKDQSQNAENQDKYDKCPAVCRKVVVVFDEERFQLLHEKDLYAKVRFIRTGRQMIFGNGNQVIVRTFCPAARLSL